MRKRLIFKGTLAELRELAESQGLLKEARDAESEKILKIIDDLMENAFYLHGDEALLRLRRFMEAKAA